MSATLPIQAIMAASTQFDFLAPLRLPDPRAAISEATRLAGTEQLPGRVAWLRAATAQVARLPDGDARRELEAALELFARLMVDDGQLSPLEIERPVARPAPNVVMIAA